VREVIKTSKAPAAIGPYSQAIRVTCGKVVFLSAVIPIDPETKEIVGKTAGEQCRQVMDNIQQVLKAAGADLSNVVKTTIFLADLNDFGSVNEMYSTYFDFEPPARSTVEVSRLPMDVKIAIEATAFL